jgi:alpha-tubulin suppressor-like RCC1 family protein
MIEKKRLKRNYVDVQTNIDDFNNLSEGILNITKLPEVFTSGKNVFKFSPNFDVVDIGYPIYIEILDSSGEPVFHEVLEFQEKDDSINVVVYVYETTKPGDCILTILSTIFVDRDGNPLNADEVFEQNYKYTHNLKINTKKKNDSEIIYLHYPQISIQEKRYSILEEKFDPEKQKTISGSADYFLSDGQVPILRARENLFKKDYENATIWFPYLSNEIIPNLTTSSFSYTSSIQKVLTPYQIFLDSRVYATSSMEVSNEIISSINQPYYITYNKIPLERNSTKNIKSFAVVDIYNLDPEAGHVSRVKVFGKSATKPNQSYELFYDGAITEKNYLVTASNYFVELPIGVFGDEIKVFDFETKVTGSINPYSYWKTTSIKGAPTATIASSSTYLLNPISVKPNAILSDKQEIILEQKSEYSANFNDNTVYSLIFDYSVEENSYDNREPLLNVYASGSSFVNNTEYGAFVAEVPLTNRDDRFGLDYSVKLPVNSAGTGVIKFLLRDGTSISNIRIVSETDFGFTPNISRLYVPIKIDHRNEFLDFKIEYFNDSLQQANITSEIYSVFFNGGNVYIYGDDSYITGSQEVGNDSVIKSEGYKGLDEAKKNVLENNPLYYYYRTTTRGINSLYVKNNDNTLWAWGYNVSGQLGLGDKVNRSSPIQVGTLKNWASASAGDDYTIAVKTDGTIWGWGSNTYRRAGITGSGAASTSSPVQIGTETNWNKVFAGTNHSLGMKRDGSLWAWGRNNNGQLGLNDSVTRSSPVQVGTETNWKDAAVAQATTVAIKNDGTLWSWGSNDSTSGRRTVETPTVVNRSLPVRIGTLSNWTSVVGNQYHYIALNTLGELWTWGEGGNGVLGQVTDTLAKSSPVQIGTLKTWVSASTGKYHSLAVKNDGTLWGWGYNFRGALGQDDLIPRSSPVQIGTGSNWLYTHGGQDFTFGIDRTGSFYAWGDNEFGQLGLNSTSHYSSSIRISTSSVRQLTSSLFGWSFNVGDPFNSGIKQNSVQLINEEGAYLDFATYPPLLDLTFKGSSSRLYVESESGSILWDGKKIVVTGVEISSSVIVGSLLTGSLPDGVVSGSPQTLEHLYGTNIVSSSEQRFVLGLAETDSPRFTNLTLDGDLTARQYIVSSSVYIVTQSFSSGSTIFGNDVNDNHEFTGSLRVLGNTHEITGSVYTLGDVHIDGDLYADILISTASYAIFAETASILMGTGTGSFSGSFTGSFDATGSFTGSHFGSASLSGSFDGIFFGQGSGSFSGSFDATGSFTGSHFGSASLSGSFDGIFFGQGSGSFSGSHFGSASLSGSFDGTFSGQGSGSFSGSHFGSASLSGSFDGIFFGQGSGSFSGSHYGDFYGLAGSINGNFTGSFSGSFTGSFDATGSFSGSHFGYHEGTASLSGSFTGSLSGTASYAETASYLLGYGIGQFTGSFSGSFTGSFDATGSFSGSHFGSASLSGSFDGIFFGKGSGSFSGSHFGSASLSGSFDGIFRGQGSGSFSGSHFGSASLSGSFSGSHFGFLNDVVALRTDFTSSMIASIPGAGSDTNIRQIQDITFHTIQTVQSVQTSYANRQWATNATAVPPNPFGVGAYYTGEKYHKIIQIGRSPILTQSILLNADTTVHPGATLTVQRFVVRDGTNWPFGFSTSDPTGQLISGADIDSAFTNPSAIIQGLSATGSMLGTFTGSLRGGSFTGSATGSFYASASIGNMQRFVGIGSSSFIGVSNPGTASFIGLASSGSLVEVFEASLTNNNNQGWTIPTWAQKVTIICIGGGGAGGAGAFTAGSQTTDWKSGGGGGAGGSVAVASFHARAFNPNTKYEIVVGVGGSKSAGLDGSGDTSIQRNGLASSFGKSDGSQYPYVIAFGGSGGQQGAVYPSSTNPFIHNIWSRGGLNLPNTYSPGYSVGGNGGYGGISGSTNSNLCVNDGFLNFLDISLAAGNFSRLRSLDAYDFPYPSKIGFTDNNIDGFFGVFHTNGSQVAPTGGGGGSGYITSSNNTFNAGRGGGIHTNRPLNQSAVVSNTQFPNSGITTIINPNTNTVAPNLHFYNTLIGLGGRGGSTAGNYSATDGAKYGGGGGGGRAFINVASTDTRRLGGNGGQGVVVIISEA